MSAEQDQREQKSQCRENEREARDTIPLDTAIENKGVVELLDDEPLILVEDEVEVISPHLQEKILPLTSFSDPVLPAFVQNTVSQMGFTKPSPIQRYCRI